MTNSEKVPKICVSKLLTNLVCGCKADTSDGLLVGLEHLDVVHVGLPVLDVAAVIT
jgi:hypothetical protein